MPKFTALEILNLAHLEKEVVGLSPEMAKARVLAAAHGRGVCLSEGSHNRETLTRAAFELKMIAPTISNAEAIHALTART